MSLAMLTANLPTLVPPNFCTSHRDDGSMLFWCRLGGVRGGDEELEEDEEDEREELDEERDIVEPVQQSRR